MSPRIPKEQSSNRTPANKRSFSNPPLDTDKESNTVEVNGETLVPQEKEDWE